MKKLGIVLLVVILLISGGILYITTNGAALIKDATESHSPEMIGTKVTLSDVSLSLFNGAAGINNFEVLQPKSFGDGTMIKADEIAIDLDPYSLMDETVKIETILIDKPVFNIIEKDGKTNLQAIQDHLNKYLEDSAQMDEADSTTKKLMINDFFFNGAVVNLESEKIGDHSVELADIHLTDIGVAEGGIEPSEMVRHISDAVMPQVTKALASVGLKNALKDKVGKLKDKIGDLF